MSRHDELGQVGIWEDVGCDNTGYGMPREEPVSEILATLECVDAVIERWNLDRSASEKECFVTGMRTNVIEADSFAWGRARVAQIKGIDVGEHIV